jgi:hypothetical protein
MKEADFMKITKEINVCPYCFKPPDIKLSQGVYYVHCPGACNFSDYIPGFQLLDNLIDEWNVETSFHHKRILHYANKTILED